MDFDNGQKRRELTIADFIAKSPPELELDVLAGSNGLPSRSLNSDRTQKLGLALAGYPSYIHSGRIQMVGQSEISYLNQLDGKDRSTAIKNIDPTVVSCILLTKSLEPPDELRAFCDSSGIPLLQTRLVSSKAVGLVTDYLLEALAPEITIHGVLIEMHGIGVLIFGESGIGKSECALDLITRGHRLVSDDSVRIKRIGKRLRGESPELTREHLEIHGLGIINIRELFGVSAIGEETDIELCIELRRWSEVENVERIGLDMQQHEIFGALSAKFVLPVSSGRNISTLIETAVRVYLLRSAGIDAAQALVEKHATMVGKN